MKTLRTTKKKPWHMKRLILLWCWIRHSHQPHVRKKTEIIVCLVSWDQPENVCYCNISNSVAMGQSTSMVISRHHKIQPHSLFSWITWTFASTNCLIIETGQSQKWQISWDFFCAYAVAHKCDSMQKKANSNVILFGVFFFAWNLKHWNKTGEHSLYEKKTRFLSFLCMRIYRN